jgi:hypothetical protein
VIEIGKVLDLVDQCSGAVAKALGTPNEALNFHRLLPSRPYAVKIADEGTLSCAVLRQLDTTVNFKLHLQQSHRRGVREPTQICKQSVTLLTTGALRSLGGKPVLAPPRG